MIDPSHNTNGRLNRDLARMRMRDTGFWGGWALLLATFGIYGFFALNKPSEMRYVTGVAGASIPLATETGTKTKTRVTVEGQTRDITLPRQLAFPAVGDVICLRAGEHRISGHTSYVIVPNARCDGIPATQGVD